MDDRFSTCGSHDVDRVIRARKTDKLLSSQDLPTGDRRSTICELLELAGMAPFHRPCDDSHRSGGELTGIEPWRFHVLDAATCRKLRGRLPTENAGKVPHMLATADALVMATWLPCPRSAATTGAGSIEASGPATGGFASGGAAIGGEASFEPSLVNMEHIAAAAAAIQNLLLAAAARGIRSYWSSGGVLRTPESFELLGIPKSEILLGAVFIFPDPVSGVEHVGSKLRELRTSSARWSRWVVIA